MHPTPKNTTETNTSRPWSILGLELCIGITVAFGCGASNESDLVPAPDGAITEPDVSPDASPESTRLVDLALGDAHGCALVSDGRVACWGENSSGQVGDGTITRRLAPVFVEGLDDAIAVYAGGYYSCAIHENQTVSCWGDNWRGNLGIGSFETRLTPTPVPGLSNVKSLALSPTRGRKHTCAVLEEGSLWCWGTNGNGEVGTGEATEDISSPVEAVVAGANVEAVATAYDWTCASYLDGTTKCWGRDYWDVLGRGATNAIPPGGSERIVAPVQPVIGLTGVVALSNGGIHSCALQSEGRARCWGPQHAGQLGAGPSDVGGNHTIDIPEIHDIKAGGSRTCMIAGANREVLCVGSNFSGGAGSPSQDFVDDFGYVYVPTKVPGLEGVEALGSGNRFACALADGELKCWGSNVFGELGANSPVGSSEMPLTVDLSNLDL